MSAIVDVEAVASDRPLNRASQAHLARLNSWSPTSMESASIPSARTASTIARIFRRGPWENTATAVIAVGVAMLCQPFSIDIYSYSFLTILTGTLLFTVVTKFPD
jgi:hypothetical protein